MDLHQIKIHYYPWIPRILMIKKGVWRCIPFVHLWCINILHTVKDTLDSKLFENWSHREK